jgi:BASS family bile acid:Na+ symporter
MKHLQKLPFAFWIIIAVAYSLYQPEIFISLGEYKLKGLIIPLLQLIMFGMGSTMGLEDFREVLKSPKSVFLGVFFHFLIMPLVGFSLTKFFHFPNEIAAGIILVGSMPCGLASNVMSYMAKANVALSLTLTSISTLLAPFLTPLLLKILANQLIEINFWEMVWEIFKLIIIPIFFGVLYKKIIGEKWNGLQKHLSTLSMYSIALIIVIITANGRDSLLKVGPLLILACLIHNLCGFVLGYYGARFSGLPEKDARTISIEVGLQNSGLASGIAMSLNKIATLGLAPAIFGPLMNITGSTLANYWKKK